MNPRLWHHGALLVTVADLHRSGCGARALRIRMGASVVCRMSTRWHYMKRDVSSASTAIIHLPVLDEYYAPMYKIIL